jgi:hypothetical protein
MALIEGPMVAAGGNNRNGPYKRFQLSPPPHYHTIDVSQEYGIPFNYLVIGNTYIIKEKNKPRSIGKRGILIQKGRTDVLQGWEYDVNGEITGPQLARDINTAWFRFPNAFPYLPPEHELNQRLVTFTVLRYDFYPVPPAPVAARTRKRKNKSRKSQKTRKV